MYLSKKIPKINFIELIPLSIKKKITIFFHNLSILTNIPLFYIFINFSNNDFIQILNEVWKKKK